MHQHIYQLEIKVRSNKKSNYMMKRVHMRLFVRQVFCTKNGGIKVNNNLSILRTKFENPKILLKNNELTKCT